MPAPQPKVIELKPDPIALFQKSLLLELEAEKLLREARRLRNTAEIHFAAQAK